MKKTILLILLLFIAICVSFGQNNYSVNGHIFDSSSRQQISDATVAIINVLDSSLVAFTRTDSTGNFVFHKLNKGSYKLSISHVNFHAKWLNFELSGIEKILKLGDIQMLDRSILQEVIVNVQRAPVVVNGDTLEFNAEAFKTKPNAVVEEMLKKMPGVEVDKDGSVRVNGKKISRILVNGKDFFNGDPTLATRNLSADAIDKVQVFEKQSDQSAFTGVDDGNSEKTINLKLKKDKMNAIFGKASAALGTDTRYEGKFNLNKFKGEKQFSAIGMTNNINQQGFAIMDVLNFTGENKKMMKGGGGLMINSNGPETGGVPVSGLGGNAQGITQTTAGGINFSDNWNKKTDLNSSYFYNNLNNINTRNVFRQNLVQGNNFRYTENDYSNNTTQSNRLNIAIDQNIDSFNAIKITSNTSSQSGNNYTKSNYVSLNENNDILNKGNTLNTSKSDGYNFSNNILFKHKFSKKGRTLSINGQMQYNNSALNSSINSLNQFFNGSSVLKIDTLDQLNNLKSITQSHGANITYTEPLSKKSLLEFRTFYNSGTGKLNRSTFDLDQSTGKHDLKNKELSNNFRNTYTAVGGGLSLRGLTKKLNYSVGVNLQSDQIDSHILDSTFSINHTRVNALPLANFNYNFTRFKSIRLDYNTSITEPTSAQLQPVKDVSDPLNIREGNPSLSQSYTNTIGLQFFSTNMSKQSSLIAFANFNTIQNAIVSSDLISNLGQRTTKPVNANGQYSLFGVLDKGFKIKKLSTRFNIGTSINYFHNVNYINSQLENTSNISYTPKLSATYNYKEFLDFTITGRWSFNKLKYSLEKQLNNNYLKQTYNADATANLPSGITLNSDIAYVVNNGRSDGYNKNTTIWNASLAKQVFKSKKGEIKLSVYNILNQNVGIDRNSNFNYIEDIKYTTLQRYFSLGFTYSLQKPSSGGPKMVIKTF